MKRLPIVESLIEKSKQHGNYKGDKVMYASKHQWIAKFYGKANTCENDPSHTSFKYDWANISGEYKRDVDDYMQLCRSCHRIMDNGNSCQKGHQYTPENTYLRHKNGGTQRHCRTCRRNAAKKYKKGKEKT